MHAAGVVADHSSERAAVVRRGIGGESQAILLCLSTKMVEDDARLHASETAHRIDFQNARHVFREIENDGGVTALPCERGASATSQERRAMFTAESDCGENVFGVTRSHDANRHLAVV